jgi:hypothetical protein
MAAAEGYFIAQIRIGKDFHACIRAPCSKVTRLPSTRQSERRWVTALAELERPASSTASHTGRCAKGRVGGGEAALRVRRAGVRAPHPRPLPQGARANKVVAGVHMASGRCGGLNYGHDTPTAERSALFSLPCGRRVLVSRAGGQVASDCARPPRTFHFYLSPSLAGSLPSAGWAEAESRMAVHPLQLGATGTRAPGLSERMRSALRGGRALFEAGFAKREASKLRRPADATLSAVEPEPLSREASAQPASDSSHRPLLLDCVFPPSSPQRGWCSLGAGGGVCPAVRASTEHCPCS